MTASLFLRNVAHSSGRRRIRLRRRVKAEEDIVVECRIILQIQKRFTIEKSLVRTPSTVYLIGVLSMSQSLDFRCPTLYLQPFKH
jgi:hypothetical protein